jgi:hypothetical protein
MRVLPAREFRTLTDRGQIDLNRFQTIKRYRADYLISRSTDLGVTRSDVTLHLAADDDPG